MSDEILTPEPQIAPEETAQLPEIVIEPPIVIDAAPVYEAPVAPPPVYQPAPQPVYQPAPQPVYQPAPQPQKAPRKELPLAVRILLKIATALLCFLLSISLLATLLVADLGALTSKETIKQSLDQVLMVPAAQPRLSQNPDTAEELVVELIYNGIYNRDDNDLTVTKEEISTFVDEASVADYLTDKAASYVEDFIKGTRNTEITTEEIEDLLDENEKLIEKTFGITMDPQIRRDILNYIEDHDINEIVQTQIIDEVESFELSRNYTLGDLMDDYIRPILSPTTLILLIAVDILLAVAIFFTKRMHLGSAMLTVGSHVFSVGTIGSVPLLILWLMPDLLRSVGLERFAIRIVDVFVNAIIPVHLTFVILGAVLMVAGIVLKILLRPKKALA